MSFKRAREFVEAEKAQYPDCAAAYTEFGQLFEKKLWYQLGLAIANHLRETRANPVQHPGRILALYTRFIIELSEKLNPLTYVEFAVAGVRDVKLDVPGAVDSALGLLKEATDVARSRSEPDSPAAIALGMAVSGEVCVAGGRLGEARTFIDKANTALDRVAGANPSVWAQYHRVRAAYHKARNEPEEFYRAALSYLSYVSMPEVPAQELFELARDLAVAALIGPTIYSIGELLRNPVSEHLKDDRSTTWLLPLLVALNRGDMPEFQSVINTAQGDPACTAIVKILREKESILKEKINILGLMELIFQQSATDSGRRISFDDISKATGVALNDVEALAIHSMALGLIRGTIDQVDRVFEVQWVKPRVLDNTQLQTMIDMLDEWNGKISLALDTLHQTKSSKEY